MGRKSSENVVLSELNRVLWQIDPIYAGNEGVVAFLGALRGYVRQFNQAALARTARVDDQVFRRLFNKRTRPSFVVVLRALMLMGLRLRIERDPVPARVAYGSAHPDYELQVDDDGAWDLGE